LGHSRISRVPDIGLSTRDYVQTRLITGHAGTIIPTPNTGQWNFGDNLSIARMLIGMPVATQEQITLRFLGNCRSTIELRPPVTALLARLRWRLKDALFRILLQGGRPQLWAGPARPEKARNDLALTRTMPVSEMSGP
jgi:hypothetical protein